MKSLPPKGRAAVILVILAMLALVFAFWPRNDSLAEPPVYTEEVLSPVYQVDQIYRSMKGPASQQEIRLGNPEQEELLWVVGYRAVMVGPDGETPLPQEFMCHSNLDVDPRDHAIAFEAQKAISGRLFTLSQGQLSIRMPDGFGIPMLSTEPLTLTTQVLNLNHVDADVEVRHKVTVEYVRDSELSEPFQPLFPQAAYGLAVLADEPAHFGRGEEWMAEGHEEMGAGCLPGENASEHTYQDDEGQEFTGHWVVPPGREVNRTLVTEILDLPFDTTVHYIAVHLHPFAESLELKDLTTGETVFKSEVRPADEGIGIDHVEYFSSPGGVPLYRDHEYELVSVYDNTSGEPQDSMAVMYMYLLDHEFQPPRRLAAR
ncbi:MAG: hypothetical protein SX243_18365 [Acidobacteriota bacterium]|nr:hypothetical protein [Acidobacteriota bacterium]